MKKLILTIITLSIITLNGCYDPDTATVRINLGNIPIAHHEPKSFIDRVLGLFEKEAYADPLPTFGIQITKVHIAAVSNDTVIATASIDAVDIDAYINMQQVESIIELNVPAGENIRIVVIGEYTPDVGGSKILSHYGHNTDDIILKPGETTSVPIIMEDISDYISFNRYSGQILPLHLYWNKLPGATVVISGSTSGEIYRGKGTRVDVAGYEDVYTANVIFEFIGLSYSTTF
jgi:hypothetical protein